MAAVKRLSKEFAEISAQSQSNPALTVELINGSDLFNWEITLKGPSGSPYEGGTFKLALKMPAEYPFKPPVLSFQTRIYHPNVSNDEKGSMCLGILRSDMWKPSCKLAAVVEMAVGLLVEPNVEDAVETSIADQYKNDRPKFNQQAKAFVQQYAKPK